MDLGGVRILHHEPFRLRLCVDGGGSMSPLPVTLEHDGQRVRATVLAFLPGQLHEPSNVFVVYMLEGSFLVKVAKLSELDLVGAS